MPVSEPATFQEQNSADSYHGNRVYLMNDVKMDMANKILLCNIL